MRLILKKCTFSRFGQEKAHKKSLYTNRLAYVEEKIKRKYIICVLTFGRRLQLVAPENRGTLLHVGFHALNYRPNSACMLS